MFYDNYIRLCNSVGKKPSAVAIEIGISKSLVSRWKSGGLPTDATAQKIADYFGVPASALVDGQKEKPTAESGELIGPAKRELLSMIDKMSEKEIVALTEMVKATLKMRE